MLISLYILFVQFKQLIFLYFQPYTFQDVQRINLPLCWSVESVKIVYFKGIFFFSQLVLFVFGVEIKKRIEKKF